MAKEMAAAVDNMEMKVAGGDALGVVGKFDAACWEQGPNGPVQVWHAAGKNVVVNAGRAHLLNVGIGNGRPASSFGMFGIPHNVSTSGTAVTNYVYSDITNSKLSNYGNDNPAFAFGSAWASGSATATGSFAITAAGAQTISGMALAWYTANTMSSNGATADVKLYNIGYFATTQQLNNSNTLSVTVTLSLATA
jgi:hypothetical protein